MTVESWNLPPDRPDIVMDVRMLHMTYHTCQNTDQHHKELNQHTHMRASAAIEHCPLFFVMNIIIIIISLPV